MNWNYCPNCGQKLQYSELAVMPPITVIECTRCGWEMREGRQLSWDTVPKYEVDTTTTSGLQTDQRTIKISREEMERYMKEVKEC